MAIRRTIVISTISLISGCGGMKKESRSIRQLPDSRLAALAGVLDYQIGATWGKSIVTKDSLPAQSAPFQRAAKATARVRLGFGGATAFVIGEKNGEVVLATNHHVIGSDSACSGAKISFEMLNITNLTCNKVINTNTDLDLTIFTVGRLTADQKTTLLSVAKSFAEEETKKGMGLLTIGYGVAGNSGQKDLMSGKDEDCKVFSPDGEVRFMADPDEFNPGPYKTWMFATGCDVSHGDSGSAIVDRETGNVVGILSTGKIPKNSVVRDASYLTKIYDETSEDVWKELTYAVPASKIREIVGEDLP